MFRTNPLFARLLTQLVPAALVTTVGVLLLSNLAKPPSAATEAAPVETAINAEAVFKITPREQADASEQVVKAAPSRTAAKPKATATNVPMPPQRQLVSPPPPLQIVQIPEQPQAAAATPDSENAVMSRLRSATAAVQRLPQWAAQSVTGWFTAEEAPPRPPAPIPVQNFQAAM